MGVVGTSVPVLVSPGEERGIELPLPALPGHTVLTRDTPPAVCQTEGDGCTAAGWDRRSAERERQRLPVTWSHWRRKSAFFTDPAKTHAYATTSDICPIVTPTAKCSSVHGKICQNVFSCRGQQHMIISPDPVTLPEFSCRVLGAVGRGAVGETAVSVRGTNVDFMAPMPHVALGGNLRGRWWS